MNDKYIELKAKAYDIIAGISRLGRQNQQLQEQLAKIEEEIRSESMKPIDVKKEIENDN